MTLQIDAKKAGRRFCDVRLGATLQISLINRKNVEVIFHCTGKHKASIYLVVFFVKSIEIPSFVSRTNIV